MKYFLLLLVLATFSGHAQATVSKRYTKVPNGYLMVLRQGDDLFRELEKLASQEQIPSANFTGMGFAGAIRFGFYNFETKKFEPRDFQKMELASLNGTIGKQKGSVSIHAHGVVTGRDFKAYGGHILSATVGTGSMEIMVLVHDKTFERQFDSTIGANVLCLENCK